MDYIERGLSVHSGGLEYSQWSWHILAALLLNWKMVGMLVRLLTMNNK